ncbi:hypothetical protein [Candidatus Leptofilum sp.]|uniref:hypothetical protein n=1 Tax=Candidatus Leptofilum sp. TaxID=3241576 RepID=UPI003B5C53F6
MSPNEDQQVNTEANVVDEVQPLPDYQIESINELQSAISDNAALISEIETIIREHLRPNPTGESIGKILGGLDLYLGEDPAYFLLHILRFSNDATYVQQVKSHCTESFWRILRRLVALYGVDVRRAYTLLNENPQSWDILNRHTYFDHLTNTWAISMEIVKYNGERLNLEETPGSALTLVRGILDMLMNVPAESAPDLIDKNYMADTFHQFYTFINHYNPELLAEPDEKDEQ